MTSIVCGWLGIAWASSSSGSFHESCNSRSVQPVGEALSVASPWATALARPGLLAHAAHVAVAAGPEPGASSHRQFQRACCTALHAGAARNLHHASGSLGRRHRNSGVRAAPEKSLASTVLQVGSAGPATPVAGGLVSAAVLRHGACAD